MKNSFFSLFFLLQSVVLLYAQEENIGNILNEADVEYINQVFVKQSGSINSVFIHQDLNALSSQIFRGYEGNLGIISQNGNQHYSKLFQVGNGNKTHLIIEGNLTFTDIKQFGDKNIIYSSLSNLGKQVHSVMLDQAGNSNKIELEVEGNSFSQETNYSISVSQRGNELGFKGSYESSSLPVEITQKSGKDGGGMSVIVTSSSFYFPMK